MRNPVARTSVRGNPTSAPGLKSGPQLNPSYGLASFLPSPACGRGAGGEGVIANSALSPTLSRKREREQSTHTGSHP